MVLRIARFVGRGYCIAGGVDGTIFQRYCIAGGLRGQIFRETLPYTPKEILPRHSSHSIFSYYYVMHSIFSYYYVIIIIMKTLSSSLILLYMTCIKLSIRPTINNVFIFRSIIIVLFLDQ